MSQNTVLKRLFEHNRKEVTEFQTENITLRRFVVFSLYQTYKCGDKIKEDAMGGVRVTNEEE
jgi:hypothetical protein